MANKTYEFHVQFHAVGIQINAKNQREARAKLMEHFKNRRAIKYLDKKTYLSQRLKNDKAAFKRGWINKLAYCYPWSTTPL